MSEAVTQEELSRRLNRTTRQVRRLTEMHGMPRNGDGSYPWPEAQEWWVRFKSEEKDRRRAATAYSDGGTDLDRARAAKEWALAEMRQLDLAERRGELLSADYAAQQLEDVCSAIRVAINNVPGKYAPRIIGLDSIGKAQIVLQDIMDEILMSLQSVSTEATDDDGDGQRSARALAS